MRSPGVAPARCPELCQLNVSDAASTIGQRCHPVPGLDPCVERRDVEETLLPPRATSSSASILGLEACAYSSDSRPSHFAAWYALHAVATATTLRRTWLRCACAGSATNSRSLSTPG
jgi:hypothetical protein